MSIYAIGDLHLSFHEKVDKSMDLFGGEWVNHAARLEENWKKLINNEDTVILAGDISWGLKLEEALPDLQWINALPGKKVIIKGNHDLWWNGIQKLNKMYDSITFLQNSCYEVDEEWCICGSRGWICPGSDEYSQKEEKVYKRELLRLKASLEKAKEKGYENIIGAMHYPPTNDKLQASDFTRLFSEAKVKTVVYGHLHGDEAYKNGINSNYNGVNYKLVSLDYIKCIPFKIV